jgi:hypothetical protein
MQVIGNFTLGEFLMTVSIPQPTMLFLLLGMMLKETGKSEIHGDQIGEKKVTFG